MKFVINNSEPFIGYPFRIMGLHGRTLFEDNPHTIGELRSLYNGKELVVLTEEAFLDKRRKMGLYIFPEKEPFIQISQAEFNYILDTLPPYIWLDHSDFFSFFSDESQGKDSTLCFSYQGLYFKTVRDCNPDTFFTEIFPEIQLFLALYLKNQVIYYVVDYNNREESFNGRIECLIKADTKVYGTNMNLLQYRKKVKNKELYALTEDVLQMEIDLFQENSKNRLIEIKQQDYNAHRYRYGLPCRTGSYKEIDYFFTGEDHYLPFTLCCVRDDEYRFCGNFPVDIGEEELYQFYVNAKNEIEVEKLDAVSNLKQAYKDFSYEDLLLRYNSHIMREQQAGGILENDHEINQIAFSLIHKFYEKYGQAFLGNLPAKNEEKKDGITLEPYTGQKLSPSCYQFIVPVQDEELLHLLRRYDPVDDCINDKIFERIKTLKGEILIWS